MPAYKMIESYMYVRLHKTNLGATQKGSAQDKKLISYDGRNSSTDHKGSDITAFSVLAKMFCFSITAAVCGGLKSSLQVYKSSSDRGSFMVVAPAMQAGLVRSPSHSCCVYLQLLRFPYLAQVCKYLYNTQMLSLSNGFSLVLWFVFLIMWKSGKIWEHLSHVVNRWIRVDIGVWGPTCALNLRASLLLVSQVLSIL